MSRFNKEQFYQVISNIQDAKKKDENIGLPLGILEFMYDDDAGYLDEFFSQDKSVVELEEL